MEPYTEKVDVWSAGVGAPETSRSHVFWDRMAHVKSLRGQLS